LPAIIAQEADYVLAEGEHGRLTKMWSVVCRSGSEQFQAYAYSQPDRQQKPGRLETRTCQAIADQQILMQLRDAPSGKAYNRLSKYRRDGK
jgi:hypothetical protein